MMRPEPNVQRVARIHSKKISSDEQGQSAHFFKTLYSSDDLLTFNWGGTKL